MDTISCYFKQVMYAIGEMSAKMIKTLTGQKPAKLKKMTTYGGHILG
jgi:hypothetical protein